MPKGQVSPADKSLKRPARRPGAEEKFFCPGTRLAVIPLIIEVIRKNFIEWIEVIADGKACLHFLNPGEVPEALSGLRRVPDHCPGLLQYSRSPERMGQCNRAGFDAGSGKCFIHSERNLPGCYSIRRRIGSYRANRRISLSTWGR